MKQLFVAILFFLVIPSISKADWFIDIGYWLQEPQDGSVEGFGLIGGANYPKTNNVFAALKSYGRDKSFMSNFIFQWTPIQLKTEDEIPESTLIADSYDITFYTTVSDNFDFGVNARFIDFQVIEDYTSSVTTVRYRLAVPMLYTNIKFGLMSDLDFSAEIRYASSGGKATYYDVPLRFLYQFSSSFSLAVGHRSYGLYRKTSEIEADVKVTGWFVDMEIGF